MKTVRLVALGVIVAASAVHLAACAFKQTAQADSAAFAPSFTPQAQSVSGSYLAGRFAQHQQDWGAAQYYMNTVLSGDARNAALREKTFLLTLGSGDGVKARALAERIVQDNGKDDLAQVFLACDNMARGDFKAALAQVEHLADDGFGRYTKTLLSAWALTGMGRKNDALAMLEETSSPTDPTYHMHAGMIEEVGGNPSAAASHYEVAMANGLTLHSAVTIANFYERQKQPEVAQLIYKGLGKLYPFNPFISALQSRDARSVAAPVVTSATDGAAYALHDLATLLYEKRAYDSARVYTRLTQTLNPQSPFTMIMAGDLAALHRQFAEALDHYNAIGKDSPLYWLARMRVAETYEVGGKADISLTLMQDMTKQKSLRVNALVALGDMYRRRDDFANALKSYDAAISGMESIKAEQWQVIYARGMALERLKQWPRAEKDLLQALEFQPNNPMILNFIGYSWADKGIHMEKALGYLKRAAAMEPDDGYILDSYGWALYRTGQYDTAVDWLERAIARVADDATILDHLGDAYWQAGRKNEARFKWARALEVSQDQSFRTDLQGKIRNGVIAAPALHLARTKEAKL